MEVIQFFLDTYSLPTAVMLVLLNRHSARFVW